MIGAATLVYPSRYACRAIVGKSCQGATEASRRRAGRKEAKEEKGSPNREDWMPGHAAMTALTFPSDQELALPHTLPRRGALVTTSHSDFPRPLRCEE